MNPITNDKKTPEQLKLIRDIDIVFKNNNIDWNVDLSEYHGQTYISLYDEEWNHVINFDIDMTAASLVGVCRLWYRAYRLGFENGQIHVANNFKKLLKIPLNPQSEQI